MTDKMTAESGKQAAMDVVHINSVPEIGLAMQTNGYSTNYHVAGSGENLLLIHGSGPGVSAWANWRLTIPQLAPYARVIAPDMVGFGYTESPADLEYHPDVWVEQLRALLDGLGVSRLSIIGNSFGGAVALRFAHRYPERVEKLILMGPVGISFPITEGLNKVWGYQPSLEAMRALLDVFVADHSIITDDLVQLRFRASTRADVQQRFADIFRSPRQRWVDMLALEPEELAAVHAATLVIHGCDDQVIPLDASRRLVRILPNARLSEIERCGHWVQIEQAVVFLSLVKSFLGT